MFSRYCGKEIMEGEVHDCEKKVVTDWKGMVFGFLKNPLDTMKETYVRYHGGCCCIL